MDNFAAWKLDSIDYPLAVTFSPAALHSKKGMAPPNLPIHFVSILYFSEDHESLDVISNADNKPAEIANKPAEIANNTLILTSPILSVDKRKEGENQLDDTCASDLEQENLHISSEDFDDRADKKPKKNEKEQSKNKWDNYFFAAAVIIMIIGFGFMPSSGDQKLDSPSQPTIQKPIPIKENCNIEVPNSHVNNAGIVQYKLSVKCKKSKRFRILYSSLRYEEAYNFFFNTDREGEASIKLDLFLGWQNIIVLFDDGLKKMLPKPDNKKFFNKLFHENGTFTSLSKIAIVWDTPIDLDLHVFEYSALHNDLDGHFWKGNTSKHQQAQQRGGGYFSHINNDDNKYEVYTFLHHRNSRSGTIDFKVDFSSRGETPSGDYCDQGKHAAPSYKTIITSVNMQAIERSAFFRRESCGRMLGPETRYDSVGFTSGLIID